MKPSLIRRSSSSSSGSSELSAERASLVPFSSAFTGILSSPCLCRDSISTGGEDIIERQRLTVGERAVGRHKGQIESSAARSRSPFVDHVQNRLVSISSSSHTIRSLNAYRKVLFLLEERVSWSWYGM